MSDMTLGYVAARPATGRGTLSNFGLAAIAVLALASAVAGLCNPAAIATEYQIDTVTFTGP